MQSDRVNHPLAALGSKVRNGAGTEAHNTPWAGPPPPLHNCSITQRQALMCYKLISKELGTQLVGYLELHD